MNSRDLKLFLFLLVFAVIWAGGVFSAIESRMLAGALAGGYFLLSGLFMVWRAYKWKNVWRSVLWYPLIIHVFGISIPMVSLRFLQSQAAFENVSILGLAGPVFHRLSTLVFAALVIGTLIDLWKTKRAGTSPQTSN